MCGPQPRASLWTPQHPAGKKVSPSPRPLYPDPALFPTHLAPTSILFSWPRNLSPVPGHPSWPSSACHLTSPLSFPATVPLPLETELLYACIYHVHVCFRGRKCKLDGLLIYGLTVHGAPVFLGMPLDMYACAQACLRTCVLAALLCLTVGDAGGGELSTHVSLYRPGCMCVNPDVSPCVHVCVSELFVCEGVDLRCSRVGIREIGSGAPSQVQEVHPAGVGTQLSPQDPSPRILPRAHIGAPLGRAAEAEEILGDGRRGAEQNPGQHRVGPGCQWS